MACVKSKHTTPEMIVRRIAHALGFRYRLHVHALPGRPDLVFPRLKKIIDVRGCFWHLHGCKCCRVPASRREYWVQKLKRNAERDKESLIHLKRGGWKVLVIWECEINARTAERLTRRIERFLAR